MLPLIKALILPPGINFLGVLVGCAVSGLLSRRTGCFVIVFSLLTLFAFSLPIVAGLSVRMYDSQVAFDAEAYSGNGIVVVLGGRRRSNAVEYGGDTVGADTLERIRYGARLARYLGLPLAVTGGTGRDGASVSLGALMAQALESEFGQTVSWVENRSQNTAENAQNLRDILPDKKEVILVTHSLHMRRALLAFEKAGFSALPAPTGVQARGLGKRDWKFTDWVPSASALLLTRSVAYEVLGSLYYWALGD